MEILIFSFSEEKQPLRQHEGESSSKYSCQYTFREIGNADIVGFLNVEE
jgi:hypothetical protein